MIHSSTRAAASAESGSRTIRSGAEFFPAVYGLLVLAVVLIMIVCVSCGSVAIPLGTTANKQGRVAGASAAGQRTRFAGVVGSAVTKVCDRYIAMTGLSPDAARKAGFDAADVEITHRDKASYYPGARPFRLRLVFERKTGRNSVST